MLNAVYLLEFPIDFCQGLLGEGVISSIFPSRNTVEVQVLKLQSGNLQLLHVRSRGAVGQDLEGLKYQKSHVLIISHQKPEQREESDQHSKSRNDYKILVGEPEQMGVR